MKIDVTFIRHAKTRGNLKRAYIGKTDEPLCDSGIQELHVAIQKGIYPPVDFLYTSGKIRCVQTASLIYPNQSQTTKSGLAECDFGDFEGKKYDELKDAPDYQRFLDSGGETPFPNGESRADFSKRCQDTFLKIIGKHHEGEKVGILCHGGTIMAILGQYSNPHSEFYTWQINNTEGYSFIFDTAQGLAIDIKKLQGEDD